MGETLQYSMSMSLPCCSGVEGITFCAIAHRYCHLPLLAHYDYMVSFYFWRHNKLKSLNIKKWIYNWEYTCSKMTRIHWFENYIWALVVEIFSQFYVHACSVICIKATVYLLVLYYQNNYRCNQIFSPWNTILSKIGKQYLGWYGQ